MKTLSRKYVTVAANLMRAAEIIREKGHCQNMFVSPTGKVCMAQAIALTRGNESYHSNNGPEEHQVKNYLLEKIGTRDLWGLEGPAEGYYPATFICAWNNMPGRTAEEVIAVLEGAATWKPNV